VNKPYLPLAAGDFSVRTGVAIVVATGAAALAIGVWAGSAPLLATLGGSLLLGIAYSTDLPFLRWKRWPLVAAGCILAVRCACWPGPSWPPCLCPLFLSWACLLSANLPHLASCRCLLCACLLAPAYLRLPEAGIGSPCSLSPEPCFCHSPAACCGIVNCGLFDPVPWGHIVVWEAYRTLPVRRSAAPGKAAGRGRGGSSIPRQACGPPMLPPSFLCHGACMRVHRSRLCGMPDPLPTTPVLLARRAVLVQLGFYLHMRSALGGAGAGAITRPVAFATAFMLLFSIVIALFKDIPDVVGDSKVGWQMSLVLTPEPLKTRAPTTLRTLILQHATTRRWLLP
jgi:hypothetical protein